MIVKQQKRGRPTGSGNKLNADVILDTAKALMKEEKKIPSIRKLALRLAVDPMAIYHYFKKKNDLLEAITTSLVEDIYEPQVSDAWQQELTLLATSYLCLLNSYPGLLTTLLSMTSMGPAQVFNQRFYIVIEQLSLSEESKQHALHLLVDYLHGYAHALNCNNNDTPLTMEMLEGPLSFYCIALENS